MKAFIAYFETENNLKIVKKSIKDGMIKFGKNKMFTVDKIKPLWILRRSLPLFMLKPYPLYILKHNISTPLSIKFKKKSWKDRRNDKRELQGIDKNIKADTKQIAVLTDALSGNTSAMIGNIEQSDMSAIGKELTKYEEHLAWLLAEKEKLDENNKENTEPQAPLDIEWDTASFSTAITPENFSKIMGQQALSELLSVKGMHKADMLMWLVLGLVMGGMAGLLLYPTIF